MERTGVTALAEGTVAARLGPFLLHQWTGIDTDPVTGRLLSVAELQAQLAAWEPDDDEPAPAPDAEPEPGWIAVVSAQPGAGCSTISAALAEEGHAVLDAGPGWAFDWRWHAQRPPAAVVVTCRASVPGVIETERLLGYLDGHPGMSGTVMLVAALGTAEWPRAVRLASGPLLTATRAAGGVVAVPYVRELDGARPGSAALPDELVTAAQALTALAAAEQHSR